MGRPKKKRPPIDDQPLQRPRPAVRPPRPHKGLFVAVTLLLVAWLTLLTVLAIQS